MSDVIIIVLVGTIIGMLWTIQKAETCLGVFINAALVIIAALVVLALFTLFFQYLGQ